MVLLNSQAARYIFCVIALQSEFSFWGILPIIQIFVLLQHELPSKRQDSAFWQMYNCGIVIAFQYQLQNFDSC